LLEDRMIDELHANEDMTNWGSVVYRRLKIHTDSESLLKGLELEG